MDHLRKIASSTRGATCNGYCAAKTKSAMEALYQYFVEYHRLQEEKMEQLVVAQDVALEQCKQAAVNHVKNSHWMLLTVIAVLWMIIILQISSDESEKNKERRKELEKQKQELKEQQCIVKARTSRLEMLILAEENSCAVRDSIESEQPALVNTPENTPDVETPVPNTDATRSISPSPDAEEETGSQFEMVDEKDYKSE